MARKVYRYQLPINGVVEIEMKVGAKILCVQFKRMELCIWALVNPDEDDEKRIFRLAGTGHDIGYVDPLYIGTVQHDLDDIVIIHVFEVTNCRPD